MLKDYLKAGFPALCVLTQEPHRAEQVLPCEGWKFFAWDCLKGIREAESQRIIEEIRDPVEAINWLGNFQDTVLMAHNLHLFLEAPEVIQSLQNGIPRWKATGSALVMISPVIQMRPEVETFFHILDLELPNDEELFTLQIEMGKNLNIKPNRKAALAAKGLTEYECETAYAYSLVTKGYFSTRVISTAKSQMIRKSGVLEFWSPTDIQEVGGLQNLKNFIQNRARAFNSGNENLIPPKGILLVGIPGTGKSLTAKATASIMGWPLIRFDVSAVKNSLVGESERRMRLAVKTIQAFGNCICWIDEIDKGFSGSKASGETDAGTTASLFGTFLTFMAENTSPVLVMATANNISALPAEFIRAGRFDACFFVDLPGLKERREIIAIMNKQYRSHIPMGYAEKLNGYTGAEIEQLAKDSLYDGLEEAFKSMIPLSRTMREEINSLREWAKTRARLANTPDEEPEEQRKIRPLKKNQVKEEKSNEPHSLRGGEDVSRVPD